MKTLVDSKWLALGMLILLLQACNLEKIAPNDGLIADFTIGNNNCTASCMVDFDASPSEGASSFSWDFGDGNTGSGQSTSHTYDSPGDYSVVLTVGGANGGQDSTSKVVSIVQDSTLNACFSIDSVTCLGFAPVEVFVSNCSQFASSYSWVWGDGNASQAENPGSHIFDNPNVYSITLTVQDGQGNTDQTTQTLSVLSPNLYSRDYGSNSFYETGQNIIKTDNGFAITGFSYDTTGSFGDYKYFGTFSQLDASGQLVNEKSFQYMNAGGINAWYEGVQTRDGGFAVVGLTDKGDTTDSNYDLYFAKLDGNGNRITERIFGENGSTDFEWGQGIIEDDDGNFVLVGRGRNPSRDNSYDFYVLKLDPNGNKLWERLLGGNESDYGNKLIQSRDGSYVLVGYTRSKGMGSNDVWLVKMDKNGNTIWDKTYGGAESDYGSDLVETSDGGFAIAGYTYTNSQGSADGYLVRTDVNGNLVWEKRWGSSDYEILNSIILSDEGGFVMVGQNSFSGNRDFWCIKTDALGETVWNRSYGTEQTEFAYGLTKSDDCGYLLVGSGRIRGQNYQTRLIKIDADGNDN